MAVLVYSEIAILAQERAGVYVSSGVDAPVDSTALARFINDAYASIYAISGARMKTVASATAWSGAHLCTGTITGLLTDIEDLLHVYVTATAPTAVSATVNGTTTLAVTTTGLVAGMEISRATGIAVGTKIAHIIDANSLIMTQAATVGSGSATTTFSPVTGTELDRRDLSEIISMRSSSAGMPTYLVPKLYAAVRMATDAPGSVNLLRLEYWPSVSGFYFPCEYARQFVPIDSATVTTPDVNDLESRDIALLAAARIAPLAGRAELVPSILADLSANTQAALARQIRAMLDAKQDAPIPS